MKRLIGTVILLVLAFSVVFPVTAAASSTVQDNNSPVVTTKLSEFWINIWNDIPKSERDSVISAYDRGLDSTNSNYGNFTVYKEIAVGNPEVYYANPTAAGFKLSHVTDLTPYEETGTVRFWIDVPKDMTVKLSLKSYDGSKYSEASTTVALKAVEEGGYQEVEVPLQEFFNANKNWNPIYTRYLLLGGVSGCNGETFLDVGEIMRVSPFEIWADTPPEPVTYDATPIYRDINGKAFIRDVNGILSDTTIVKAFNNNLEKANFESAVKDYNSDAKLLALYTVNVLSAGIEKPSISSDSEEYQYKMVGISDYVELYIPVTEQINKNYITVATYSNGGITECEFVKTDEYLIINTNAIENILIIDTNAPVITADTISTDHETRMVNDNTNFNDAMYVKKAVSSGYVMLFNEYDTPLTDITDWLKNEEGQLRFWVKTPYRTDVEDIDLRIALCVRYYINGSGNYPKNSTVITVPADGEWHEMRISSTEFSSTAFDNILNNEAYRESYNAFYIYISSNINIEAMEGLYFTDYEFYGKSLMYDESDGNVHKEYFEIASLTSDNYWKKGNTNYVTRTTVTTDELPFFTKVTSVDTTDKFNTDTNPSLDQIGFAYRNGVSCADFAEWVYYNPRAEMRFWVKTKKDVTFELELHEGATGKNNTVKATVSVTGSPDWQEVRLRRSDFATKAVFDNVFISGEYTTSSVTLFISDIISGLSAGDNISFAQDVEFFTFEAYAKGDITLDGNVDAVDLVRIKKHTAGYTSQTVNGDIDSDGAVTAIDLAYVRNWLMSGEWK